MDLAGFYSLMAVTCFTLVGLWWTVVERHPEWKRDAKARRLAGGVYLSFLLPLLIFGLLLKIHPRLHLKFDRKLYLDVLLLLIQK